MAANLAPFPYISQSAVLQAMAKNCSCGLVHPVEIRVGCLQLASIKSMMMHATKNCVPLQRRLAPYPTTYRQQGSFLKNNSYVIQTKGESSI